MYAKVNKKVYEFFGFVVGERYQFKGGNYLLWNGDITKLGVQLGIERTSDFNAYQKAVAAEVGAVLLTPYEAKAEQQGTATHELPESIDVRFRVEGAKTVKTSSETSEEFEETSEETEEKIEEETTNEEEDKE